MKKIVGPLAAAVLALAFAHAQASDARLASVRIGVDCKDDFAKFCKNPAPGSSPLRCILAHKSEIAPACLSALDAAMDPAAARGKQPQPPAHSCKDEFVKVCAGAKSGELKRCLQAHRGELSEFCRKMLDLSTSRPKKKPAKP